MLKSVMGVAAATMLAAFAASGPANAADEQRQAQNSNPGVHEQTAGEEFSSQRRRWRRGYRGYRYAYPRHRYRYWGPGPGAYYYGYPYAYRRYYAPGPYVQFGPFGFGFY